MPFKTKLIFIGSNRQEEEKMQRVREYRNEGFVWIEAAKKN